MRFNPVDPGLDALIKALESAGLGVGVTEILRIQRVLSLEPDVDLEGLGRIVAAVVVKSPADRRRFDQVFAAWREGAEEKLAEKGRARVPPAPLSRRPRSIEPGPTMPGPASRPPTKRWALAAAIGFVLIAAGVLLVPQLLHRGKTTDTKQEPDAGTTAAVVVAGDAAVDADVADADVADADVDAGNNVDSGVAPDAGEALRAAPDTRRFPGQVPEIVVASAPMFSRQLLLGLLALAMAAGLWLALRNRSYLPKPAPPPTRPGPPEISLTAPAGQRLELLDARAEDALVWGIGRFTTDDATEALDVDRSVEATVQAGGLPVLRFQRQGRHRTVWLWGDESSPSPMIERLEREITTALGRVGLPVERAGFWAVPDRLSMVDGTSFTPSDAEEDQAHAIIAVLTDGGALSIRHAGVDRRPRIKSLLETLAHFPRLAFIDFSDGRHGLADLAAKYRIAVFQPEDAALFLAGGRVPPKREREPRRLRGDARAWAAACALAPRPIDEETAFALRRALRLRVSPWTMQALRRQGMDAGGLLDWPFPTRVALCDWIRRAERARDVSQVEPESLLGQALKFFRERYEAEVRARAKHDGIKPWFGTPAERIFGMERALLDLWDKPDEAARVLYSFVGTDLEEVVKGRARNFVAREAEGTQAAIVLPWLLRERPDEVRVMLEAIDFGAAVRPAGRAMLRQWSGRLLLGVGLAAGLGLGGVVTSVIEWSREVHCTVEGSAWCDSAVDAKGDWRLLGGTGAVWRQVSIKLHQEGRLRLKDGLVPCEEAVSPGMILQRCGRDLPAKSVGWTNGMRRRIAVVEGDPADKAIKGVTDELLDQGAADVVIRAAEPIDLAGIDDVLGRVSKEGKDQVVILAAPRKAGETSAWQDKAGEAKDRFGDDVLVADIGEVMPGSELVELRGHTGWVHSAAFSPDGRRVVTASGDETARVWELDGQGTFLELKTLSRVVYSAAFSPDGKRVVTASYAETPRVWELNGWGTFLELEGHHGTVLSAAFSPDGKRVVTGSTDNTARVWELDGSGKFLELKGHAQTVNSATFSPNGKQVVTGSTDNTARVWELDGSGKFLELKGHADAVKSAAFSPDGTRIVTASRALPGRVSYKLSAFDCVGSARCVPVWRAR